MSRPSLLVLVRHAESERNKLKQGSTYFPDEETRKSVKGIPDYKIPITLEGREHALRTGSMLRERFGTFDYAYHSGYQRTEDTLTALLEAYSEEERQSIHVRMNQFIRERDAGYMYDMTDAEAEASYPWLREYWATQGGYFARPPGGESLSDVSTRVYTFLNTLFRDRAGQRVLVVTHGGTLRCFRFLLERWDFERATKWPEGESPRNCGITTYGFDPKVKRLVLETYNEYCE